MTFWTKLFSADFMPHVYCLRDPQLIRLHVVSDALIAASYFLIPYAIVLLVKRRRDLAFSWMFLLFGAFILSCGLTHVLSIWTLWHPIYRFEGLIKAITALVSLPTALVLISLVPKAVALPSQQQLRRQILEREKAELEIRRLNAELELRVAERTAELEQANRRLIESETRTRDILDSARALIYVKDRQGRLQFVNRQFETNIGIKREVALGKTDFELFPFHLAERYVANDRAVYLRGAQEVEEVAEQGGEEHIYLSAKVPLLDMEGNAYGLCGISTDITDRKRAERALAESEERFRTLAEAVPDMLFSTNAEGALTYASQRFKDFTHLHSDTLQESWRAIVHEDDYVSVDELWRKSIAQGSPFECECRISQRDHASRWFVVRALPIRDEKREIAQWLGACTDIDRMKRIEAALRRSNEELGQFAYAAAHDLQEPMRNISNSLGLLGRSYQSRLDASGQELIRQSVKSAQRMLAMMRDLLAYSNAVGEEPVAPMETDANAILRQTLTDLQSSLDENKAQVTMGMLPVLPVRDVHLSQLFVNLVGNALKYKRQDASPAIQVSASRQGDKWQFAVSDNGIGFEPAYAERIFGVFKRLHTRDQYEGSGIGLAICARIVSHYGGRIWAEAVSGKGATFRFTLPAEALSN